MKFFASAVGLCFLVGLSANYVRLEAQSAAPREPGRWIVPDFASDDDQVCVGVHPLVRDNRCIGVGELRALLRKTIAG